MFKTSWIPLQSVSLWSPSDSLLQKLFDQQDDESCDHMGDDDFDHVAALLSTLNFNKPRQAPSLISILLENACFSGGFPYRSIQSRFVIPWIFLMRNPRGGSTGLVGVGCGEEGDYGALGSVDVTVSPLMLYLPLLM